MYDYSYVIDNLKFSYSSLSSFNTCKLGWKLNYIDAEERTNNGFAEFGLVVHQTLEKYFKKELSKEELPQYYAETYPLTLVSGFPSYPPGMDAKYYVDGLWFFQSLDIDLDKYRVIILENAIETEYDGIKLIVKPDLVVKNLETGQIELWDYKSSKPVRPNGKWDLKKLEDYERQMLLYKYFVEKERGVHIDKINLLFVRLGRNYEVEVTDEKMKAVLDWVKNTVREIQWEEDFSPNNSKENRYFCQNICAMRRICLYKDG